MPRKATITSEGYLISDFIDKRGDYRPEADQREGRS